MSKSKEEIKAIILSNDVTDKLAPVIRDASTRNHLQQRQYTDIFGDAGSNTCTYDWYDAQAFDTKHLQNYVCSFLSSIDSFMSSPQKRNLYYFTQCGKCGYIILTNRDIGKKLVCMNPRESCGHYNHTQPLANDQFMSDVIELVNTYFKLNI